MKRLLIIVLVTLSFIIPVNSSVKYEISEELAVSILNYLKQRPYKEVFGAIPRLERLKKIVEPTKNVEAK